MTPVPSPLRVLVNALSVSNTSGAHVLLGHLAGLSSSLEESCRFILLCREEQRKDFMARLGERVDWVSAPAATRQWLRRALWERRHLAGCARAAGAGAYFTPSGMAAAALHLPQVVFCQNPWALVPSARRLRDAPKAWLQRLAYKSSVRRAAVMAFNSRYMLEAYRRNAGHDPAHSLVVYQAAEDSTRQAAARAAAENLPRIPGRILCVSAMGPHKNVEAVVKALQRLRAGGVAAAHLVLAGSWPDRAYEHRIRKLVRALRLDDAVEFAGFLARRDLDLHYARAQVFCLMSRCESFGIPAIEAQLFGTPVVCSNVCAVPEICGEGGLCCDPDDVHAVSAALRRLLTDAGEWSRLSALARTNADRFRWPECSRPLAGAFRRLAGS